MATIGLYGVFYKPCKKVDGVTVGYEGTVKMMGKAVNAGFTPNVPSENALYANNALGESDVSAGSGGSLNLTLDRMTLETAADLYGTEVKPVSVTVDGETATGTEIVYKGTETSKPVGTAYIMLGQEDGVRSHDVVFYREAFYTRPKEDAKTIGKAIEWQTPSISASVTGMQGDGNEPWYRKARFSSQRAAIAYIYSLFGETFDGATVTAVQDELTEQ